MGFFLRVRPEAATTITTEGGTFEGIQLEDPDNPGEIETWGKGATRHGLSEEQMDEFEATGLFERVDDSFIAIRLREDEIWSPLSLGLDLSNARELAVVDEQRPFTLGEMTEADFMLQQLGVHFKASGLDEESFREKLRADPHWRVYADAEIPEPRFTVSRSEAIAMIANDEADPIYADHAGGESLLNHRRVMPGLEGATSDI